MRATFWTFRPNLYDFVGCAVSIACAYCVDWDNSFQLSRWTLLLGCNWGRELTPCVIQVTGKQRKVAIFLTFRLYFYNRLGYEVSNECAYCVDCGQSFRLSRLTLLLGCNWGQEVRLCVERVIWKQRYVGDTLDLQALFTQFFGDVRSVIRVRFVLTRAIAFDLAA
jgi:hypothetical protein